MVIPQKIKNGSAFGPVIPLLGICLKKPKTLIWKNINIPLLIAALFAIVKVWKQPKSPSVGGVDKTTTGHLHVEYYLAIKKKKILPFVTVWMNLENIMLSEKASQRKTNTIWFHSYVESNEQT